MAYTKQTWTKGDVITAQKLNNIENGIESAEKGNTVIINFTVGEPNQNPNGPSGQVLYDIETADKTPQEVYELMEQGYNCIAKVSINIADSVDTYYLQFKYTVIQEDNFDFIYADSMFYPLDSFSFYIFTLRGQYDGDSTRWETFSRSNIPFSTSTEP